MERIEEAHAAEGGWDWVLSCGHTLRVTEKPVAMRVMCPKCKKAA